MAVIQSEINITTAITPRERRERKHSQDVSFVIYYSIYNIKLHLHHIYNTFTSHILRPTCNTSYTLRPICIYDQNIGKQVVL